MTAAQLKGPVYFGFADLSSSCNWVLTYSVGKVIIISRPPAMPPEKEISDVLNVRELLPSQDGGSSLVSRSSRFDQQNTSNQKPDWWEGLGMR